MYTHIQKLPVPWSGEKLVNTAVKGAGIEILQRNMNLILLFGRGLFHFLFDMFSKIITNICSPFTDLLFSHDYSLSMGRIMNLREFDEVG